MKFQGVREMRLVVAVAGLALLAGCSDTAGQEAAGVAVSFASAPSGQACALLAPATLERLTASSGLGCDQALAEAHLPTGVEVTGVTVASESAQVRLSTQVLFLARFPSGWRVTAAGCRRDDPDPAVPYACAVEP